MDDEDEKISGRDPAAWEALYRRARPRLLALARRRTGTHERAEEAVSETMTRAWQKADGYDPALGSTDAWLFGIMRFVALEHGRARPDADRLAALAVGDPGPGADGALLADEEAAALRSAFVRLEPAERELLELRVVARLSAEEVGAVLGRSPGAVRTAQSRALAKLRDNLREVAGG